VEAPRALIGRILDRLDLTPNESKACEVSTLKESFRFLGFEIHIREDRNKGSVYPYVRPTKKAMTKIRGEVTRLTRRHFPPVPLEGAEVFKSSL